MTHTDIIEKAAGAINANGLHTHTNTADFPMAALKSQAIANQIAVMALAGHTVDKGNERIYLVCKFGLSRWCKDFSALQAFAVKLGGWP